MPAPPGIPSTLVAVDWSGARAERAQRAGICAAIARPAGSGAITETVTSRTRVEMIELIEALPGPLVVGFDFSFSVPEWFARECGCTTIDAVWSLAASDGEDWLRPTPPFWRERCEVPSDRRFRRCETDLPPAKSIFQLVGNGQVGAGSVRGMPLLARLRRNGFAIWPFDASGERTALEIYPSYLRRISPRIDRSGRERVYASPHERDAVESVAVMWEHRACFATLVAAFDPVTRIEGDVWVPR